MNSSNISGVFVGTPFFNLDVLFLFIRISYDVTQFDKMLLFFCSLSI